MVFADSLTKAGRLLEVQRMFTRQPSRARTTREISEHLQIPERTIRKYLNELSGSGQLPIYRDGRNRWRLVEGARLRMTPVRFELEEATALYVAARRMARRSGEPGPALRGAVAKLSNVVPEELSPAFERLANRTATGEDAAAKVFRDLAYGWATSRVVHLRYTPRTRPGEREGAFRPYLLEPAAVGSALYAVGLLEPPGQLRVLRLERITYSALKGLTFVPPPVEELLERIERSWSVWLADDDPVEVRLHFAPAASALVRETRWHPSQQLEPAGDGGVELRLTVASTTELVPWILGWGPNCRVLAPKDLRGRIAEELRSAAGLY